MIYQGGGGFPTVVYLILAYAFGIVALGGYLVWSLYRLRGLEDQSTR